MDPRQLTLVLADAITDWSLTHRPLHAHMLADLTECAIYLEFDQGPLVRLSLIPYAIPKLTPGTCKL